MRRLVDVPEANVAIFAFLLHLPWEFGQVPLFAELPTIDHWRGIMTCGRATLGDVALTLVAFWAAALGGAGRAWIKTPTPGAIAAFVIVGVSMTIVMEWLATNVLGRWTYGESMPVLPVIEVGLSPVLQWMVIPLLVVWFVRRQLA